MDVADPRSTAPPFTDAQRSFGLWKAADRRGDDPDAAARAADLPAAFRDSPGRPAEEAGP